MPNTYIKFSHPYPKLDDETFTTIRRRNKGLKESEVYQIKSPKHNFSVVCTGIEKTTLADIPDRILLKDTNTKTREAAYKLLQSFYKKPIDFQDEIFYLFYLTREDAWMKLWGGKQHA